MVNRDISGLERISRLADSVSTIDRYDLLLGAIPAAFVVAFLAGHLFDLSVEMRILGGGAVSVLALFDGLFFRPPTGLQGRDPVR